VGRRKAQKLVDEDGIDAHVGGVLSNVCLACMPVWEEYKIVNMVGVCLDTTMTTTKCSRYTFRPFDYAPAQAVAFAPYLVNKMGFGWEQVHNIAEQIEHIQSPEFFSKMDELLGFPKVDPHGSPIPDSNGRLEWLQYKKLSDCKTNETVTLAAVIHSSDEFLKFLNSRELQLGTTLKIKSVEAFDGSMNVSARPTDVLVPGQPRGEEHHAPYERMRHSVDRHPPTHRVAHQHDRQRPEPSLQPDEGVGQVFEGVACRVVPPAVPVAQLGHHRPRAGALDRGREGPHPQDGQVPGTVRLVAVGLPAVEHEHDGTRLGHRLDDGQRRRDPDHPGGSRLSRRAAQTPDGVDGAMGASTPGIRHLDRPRIAGMSRRCHRPGDWRASQPSGSACSLPYVPR